MAIGDTISALQAVQSSLSSRLSIVGVSVPVSSTTTILGISSATENRLLGVDDAQDNLSTKIADLASLKTKLLALNTAALAVQKFGSTQVDNAIDTLDTDQTLETVELDETDLTNAGITIQDGDAIVFDTAFATGISANTTYYAHVVDSSGDPDIELYTTQADALVGNGTNRVNIQQDSQGDGTGDARTSTPTDTNAIQDLFDAFNEVQEFLEEITASDGSLPDEPALSSLGRELTTSIRNWLTSSDFADIIDTSSGTRVLTESDLSTTVTDLLTNDRGNLLSLFTGSSGIGALVEAAVNPYVGRSGVLDTLSNSLLTANADSDSKVSTLLEKAIKQQDESVDTISKVAASMAVSTQQISFLQSLFS